MLLQVIDKRFVGASDVAWIDILFSIFIADVFVYACGYIISTFSHVLGFDFFLLLYIPRKNTFTQLIVYLLLESPRTSLSLCS